MASVQLKCVAFAPFECNFNFSDDGIGENCCPPAWQQSAAAVLLLRALLQLSTALKGSFPFDEEIAGGGQVAAATCPPPFSPLLLQLLRLLQLTHKHSPALGSAVQLCCSVAERYVGWIDLLLPPPPRTGVTAEARSSSDSSSSSSSSPNMLQLLGGTWLSTGVYDAASAIVVFIHRKMEPAARIDLLRRMEVSIRRCCGIGVRQAFGLCSGLLRLLVCMRRLLSGFCTRFLSRRSPPPPQ